MAGPQIFDPYNKISFLQINRRKRHGHERTEAEKIYNRPAPAVKKIFLRRNIEDARSKPFVWRMWKSPNLQSLIAESRKFLSLEPLEATKIYNSSGTVVDNEEQIIDGEVYIVAAEDDEFQESAFDAITRTVPGQTKRQVFKQKSDASQNCLEQVRSTSAVNHRHCQSELGENEGELKNGEQQFIGECDNGLRLMRRYSLTSSDPQVRNQRLRMLDNFLERSRSANSGISSNTEVYNTCDLSSGNNSEIFNETPPKPYEAVSNTFGYDNNLDDLQSNFNDKAYEPHMLMKTQKKSQKIISQENLDRKFQRRHRSKTETTVRDGKKKYELKRRSSSTAIFNRRDQTHPDAYIIYVFLNGHGLDSQCIHFQRSQLERGMSYVLEIIAKGFGVNPAKLCNMDGSRVKQVTELMSRGAYILVPVSQAFRDAWYFLPDNAIDTSLIADKESQNNDGRKTPLQTNIPHVRSHSGFQMNVENRFEDQTSGTWAVRQKARKNSKKKRSAVTGRNNGVETNNFGSETVSVRPGDLFSNIVVK